MRMNGSGKRTSEKEGRKESQKEQAAVWIKSRAEQQRGRENSSQLIKSQRDNIKPPPLCARTEICLEGEGAAQELE